MATRVHAESPLPAAAKIQAGRYRKLSMPRVHREEMGRRGEVPRDGECPPRGAKLLGEGHPSPDEHCASSQDASSATGGQPSAESPRWSSLSGRICGPTCRRPAMRARRGALGCNEGPAGWCTDAIKRNAREPAIPGSDAFWYIRTLATELVHELGELGPLGVKCNQLAWSKASHSLDQEVRWNAVSERLEANTTCKWLWDSRSWKVRCCTSIILMMVFSLELEISNRHGTSSCQLRAEGDFNLKHHLMVMEPTDRDDAVCGGCRWMQTVHAVGSFVHVLA